MRTSSKAISECKETLEKTIHWCNDNDDFYTAENIEIYLQALRNLCVRAVEHVIDLDGDYIIDNYDGWGDYLMENFGLNYEDFKTLTNAELADVFNNR